MKRAAPLGPCAAAIVFAPWWQSHMMGMIPPLPEPPSLPMTMPE